MDARESVIIWSFVGKGGYSFEQKQLIEEEEKKWERKHNEMMEEFRK